MSSRLLWLLRNCARSPPGGTPPAIPAKKQLGHMEMHTDAQIQHALQLFQPH